MSQQLRRRKLIRTGQKLLVVLFLCGALTYAFAERRRVSIPSASMKRSLIAEILLPQSYKSGKLRYSAVYLLHGYSGNHTSWSGISPLDKLSDTYQCIIICPDGDYRSWYIDSPVKTNSRFETYITREVIPYVDSYYRTFASAHGRAIIGSSMGGHGALYLLGRYPDLFCGAGSISGIMDLAEFAGEWDLQRVLGAPEKDNHFWKEYSILGSIDRMAKSQRAIILDCGVSDFALAGNRKTHELLIAAGVAHEYYERPGAHTWEYPQKVLEYHLHYFSKLLKKPK